jgi:hypothetical protein
MKNKPIKDVGKSTLAKLLNFAKQTNIDFNRILLLYFQERFLHRLSISEYCDRLILKGGVLFYGAHLQNARPTKDIDFLGRHISKDTDSILTVVQQIVKIEANDGVIFNVDGIKLTPQFRWNPATECHFRNLSLSTNRHSIGVRNIFNRVQE